VLPSVAEAPPVWGRSLQRHRERASTALSLGFVTAFLSVVVVLPIAALVWSSTKSGGSGFWTVVSSPEAVAALAPRTRDVHSR